MAFKSLHFDLIVGMDSMNEVLCDLSARLGHELKLKDEQNQVIQHLLCGRDVLVVLPTGFSNSLIFLLFVMMLARNSSSTGSGRSAIVTCICPLESIIQDQVLEAQSIGVNACSLCANNLSELCENAPQILVAKAEDIQNPVENSKSRRKFKISTSGDVRFGLFFRQNHGAECNIQWDCGRFFFLPSTLQSTLPFPKPEKAWYGSCDGY